MEQLIKEIVLLISVLPLCLHVPLVVYGTNKHGIVSLINLTIQYETLLEFCNAFQLLVAYELLKLDFDYLSIREYIVNFRF